MSNWNVVLSSTRNLNDVLIVLQKVLALLQNKADVTTIDEALDSLATLDQQAAKSIREMTSRLNQFDDDADAATNEAIMRATVRGFATEQILKQWTPDFNGARAKADDTKSIYRYDESLPVNERWVNTGMSELDQARAYSDELLSQIPEPPQIEILTGEQLYNRAKDNPTQIFNAIWQEYNKPVYHIGNGTFVDVTGVTVVPYVVIPELVFKVKLTADNEKFVFPTRNTTALPINMQIDWGDGTSSNHSSQIVDHTYSGAAGDEFTVRVTGSAIPYFDFSSNNARRTSRLMLNSIEKNTLPARSMEFFSIMGCDNIRYIGPEAFQSFSGTTLSLSLASYQNVTFHKDAFKGLQHITNINNLLGGTASNGLYTLPAGLFDYFIGVKFAQNLFRLIDSPLPSGILDKMINLEDVTSILQAAKITSIDNRIFKNQKKLVNVTSAFQGASSLVADAYQLYSDMNQGAPTTTKSCFLTANAMTNLASVPTTWK